MFGSYPFGTEPFGVEDNSKFLLAEASSFSCVISDAVLLASFATLFQLDQGSLVVQERDANIIIARKVTLDTIEFSLVGGVLPTPKHLQCTSTSFSISGNTQQYSKSTVLLGTTLEFILTTPTASIIVNRILESNPVSFIVTSEATDLLVSRATIAEPIQFVLTGNNLQQQFALALLAGQTDFTLSGNSCRAVATRLLENSFSSFALSVYATQLSYNASGVYGIAVDSANFQLTGNNLTTLSYKNLPLNTATYVTTGKPLEVYREFFLTAAPVSFSCTSFSGSLFRSHRLVTGFGEFSFNASPLSAARELSIGFATTTFSTTVLDIGVVVARLLNNSAASFLLTGNILESKKTQLTAVEVGAFDLTGSSLVFAKVLQLAQSNILLTTGYTNTLVTRTLQLDKSTYELITPDIWSDVGTNRVYTVIANSADFTYFGEDGDLFIYHYLPATRAAFILRGNNVKLKSSLEGSAPYAQFITDITPRSIVLGNITPRGIVLGNISRSTFTF